MPEYTPHDKRIMGMILMQRAFQNLTGDALDNAVEYIRNNLLVYDVNLLKTNDASIPQQDLSEGSDLSGSPEP